MSLGVYIHIPYCLQRCTYCDFATYEIDSILAPEKYVELVKKEMQLRAPAMPTKDIDSIYFGGGTPSLLQPKHIVSLITELANLGFHFQEEIEITIEINPSTNFDQNLEGFLMGGVNRFSVGAQSFSDEHLQACGRKHSSQETIQTLDLLKKKDLNFTLDILFALPQQTIDEVRVDVEKALSFQPKHISTYCLTVPEGHKMSFNRPLESVQVDMFDLIKEKLNQGGFEQYEISNFSKPGFHSRHNMIYWTDRPYWGLGLSAHSYFPSQNLRFWNPKSIGEYQKLIQSHMDPLKDLGNISHHLTSHHFEFLKDHEIMSDYCHIFLRILDGLPDEALRNKFSELQTQLILNRLKQLQDDGLVQLINGDWKLTQKGLLVSNLVFEKLHFSKDDIRENSLYT